MATTGTGRVVLSPGGNSGATAGIYGEPWRTRGVTPPGFLVTMVLKIGNEICTAWLQIEQTHFIYGSGFSEVSLEFLSAPLPMVVPFLQSPRWNSETSAEVLLQLQQTDYHQNGR